MKILFRADAFIDIGIGDLMSCLNLGQTATKRGHEVHFLVRDYNHSISLLNSANVDYSTINHNASIEEEIEYIYTTCEDYKPDVFFMEITKRSYDDYLPLNKNKIADILAVIDFQGSASSIFDLLINWEVDSNLLYDRDKFKNTYFLLGPDKVILPSDILTNISEPRFIPQIASKILIVMGGSDPFNISIKIIKVLNSIERQLNIRVLFKISQDNQLLLNKVIQESNHNIKIIINKHQLGKYFIWCDIAFSAGGLLASELISLGTPLLLISNYPHQVPRCEYLADMKAAIYCGDCHNFDVEYMKKQFIYLLDNPTKRKDLSLSGIQLFSNKGGNALIISTLEQLTCSLPQLQKKLNKIQFHKIIILALNPFSGLPYQLAATNFSAKFIFSKGRSERRLKGFEKEIKSFGMSFEFMDSEEVEKELLNSINHSTILISLGWPHILSSRVVSKWSGYAFNLHPAILPDFPGYSPEWEVIANNQYEHGITFHLLSDVPDQGSIIAQMRFPVKLSDNAIDLQKAAFDRIPKFLVDCLNKLRDGFLFYKNSDNHLIKKICPSREPSDSEIDPSLPFIDIFHHIRACHPLQFPAFFRYKGEKISISLNYESFEKEKRNRRIVILQPAYIPWLGFFEQIDMTDIFVFLDHVQYTHRSYYNRNYILGSNGQKILLTVPLHKSAQQTAIKDMRIYNDNNWKKKHLSSIKHSYSKTPYYNDVLSLMEKSLFSNHKFLGELTVDIILNIANYLGTEAEFILSSDLDCKEKREHLMIEIASKCKADTLLTGSSGKILYHRGLFEKHKIWVEYQEYEHPQYYQSSEKFIPYLSIIDLITHAGPYGKKILRTTNYYDRE